MAWHPAVRPLRRSPWYTATAVATIALTIGLGATVFAVVDGVLFRPLPYPDADGLFRLTGVDADDGSAFLAPADIDYLDAAHPGIRVAGVTNGQTLLHRDRPDARLTVATVGPGFFDVLGQRPLVGGFTSPDFEPSTGPTRAVLSHDLWRQWLGGAPDAIGTTIDLVGRTVDLQRLRIAAVSQTGEPTELVGLTIVVAGVLPQDFVFPDRFRFGSPDLLLPQAFDPARASDRTARLLFGLARLDADVTPEVAADRFAAALAARVDEYPDAFNARPGPYVGVDMTPLAELLGREARPMSRAAIGIAACLILLGALNVTLLVGARLEDRRRELAVRTALGAGRTRLVRLLLGEVAAVGLGGAALGLLTTRPLLELVVPLLPDRLDLVTTPTIDWRVALFGATAAVAPLCAVALWPVRASVAAAPTVQLAGTATTRPRVRSWGRTVLLASQSTLGLILVMGGTLLITSYLTLRAEDIGFDAERLVLVELTATGNAPEAEPALRWEAAAARIAQVPGVRGLGIIAAPVLSGGRLGSRFAFPAGAEGGILAGDLPVGGDFFDVAGLEVLDGRGLTRADAGRPVAVVSESVARNYWPGQRAVDQTLTGSRAPATVVGVVEDARIHGQAAWGGRVGEIYLPRSEADAAPVVFFIGTNGDTARLAADLRQVLRQDVPGVIATRVEPFEAAVAGTVRTQRFQTVIIGVVGGAGLLLLIVGVAGLVATGVARRRREVGIRTALGAQRRTLTAMILFEHLRPVVLGVAAGLVACWWATRLVASFLYETDPHDPRVWAATVAVVLLSAAAAAWLPARRASAVDPMVVLRAE